MSLHKGSQISEYPLGPFYIKYCQLVHTPLLFVFFLIRRSPNRLKNTLKYFFSEILKANVFFKILTDASIWIKFISKK